jgi:uncharacterized membrane protein
VTGPLDAPVGFVLDRGRLTTFKVPGAQVTFPYGINDHGQVVGLSSGGLTATTASGFLRDAQGRFTAINRPGATVTVAFDVNDRGQVAGGYYDPSGRQHGFLRDLGRYQTLDAPGGNVAYGINDRGEVVLPDPRAAHLLPVAT